MAYQVIARKYRPQRFQDVVGQEHVTQTLANAILQKRIAHAYLFVGPRGTGKTTLARIFAKCLNATEGPSVDYPDSDPLCLEITEGRSLDVLEIDGASNRGIEEIRELRDTIHFAPASARYKIYIIDEVHMLTKEAFNALLKTLEEPPPHVKFMFATTEPEKVLPTILSRCQRFDLRPIPAPLIVKHLGYIAGQEGVTIDPGALFAIARGADGGMRDAESILDQLISFRGNHIGETDVLSMFGLASKTQVIELAEAILQGNSHHALSLLHQLMSHGKELGLLLADILTHFRDLFIFNLSKGDQSLLEQSLDAGETLVKQSSLTSPEALSRILDVLTQAETQWRSAVSKKIFLEITLIKAIQASQSLSINQVLQALKQIKNNLPSEPLSTSLENPPPVSKPTLSPAAPVKAPAMSAAPMAPPPSASASSSAAFSPPSVASGGALASTPLPDLTTLWHQILDYLRTASPLIHSSFQLLHPLAITPKVITLGIPSQHQELFPIVDSPKQRAILREFLRERGWERLDIEYKEIQETIPESTLEPLPSSSVTPTQTSQNAQTREASSAPAAAPTASAPPPPPAEPISMEEFKNDPLIQKALEIFKGQIVHIRP